MYILTLMLGSTRTACILQELTPTDIYISTDDNLVYYPDTVNSSDSFVTDNPDPYFYRDNSRAKDIKIHRIASKIWIILLIPLLRSAIMLIPSGNNWI